MDYCSDSDCDSESDSVVTDDSSGYEEIVDEGCSIPDSLKGKPLPNPHVKLVRCDHLINRSTPSTDSKRNDAPYRRPSVKLDRIIHVAEFYKTMSDYSRKKRLKRHVVKTTKKRSKNRKNLSTPALHVRKLHQNPTFEREITEIARQWLTCCKEEHNMPYDSSMLEIYQAGNLNTEVCNGDSHVSHRRETHCFVSTGHTTPITGQLDHVKHDHNYSIVSESQGADAKSCTGTQLKLPNKSKDDQTETILRYGHNKKERQRRTDLRLLYNRLRETIPIEKSPEYRIPNRTILSAAKSCINALQVQCYERLSVLAELRLKNSRLKQELLNLYIENPTKREKNLFCRLLQVLQGNDYKKDEDPIAERKDHKAKLDTVLINTNGTDTFLDKQQILKDATSSILKLRLESEQLQREKTDLLQTFCTLTQRCSILSNKVS